MTRRRSDTLIRYVRTVATGATSPDLPDRDLLARFSVGRDEVAFAALVRRHGPMILRLCRRVVGNDHDAEDAFQAVFVALSRHAGRLRPRESLAGWLYCVASRAAQKARVAAARRAKHEGRVTHRPAADPLDQLTVREAHDLLDRELARLPDKFRGPLVLCYLEGLTRDEAARHLGWRPSVFKSRLEQARDRLRQRLHARGLGLSGALVAALLFDGVAPAAVSAGLLDSTVAAAGGAAIPPEIAALAHGVVNVMVPTKLRVVIAMVIGIGLAGAAAGVLARRATADPPPRAAPSAPSALPPELAAPDTDAVAYGGRVLGPDGKPLAGAKVYEAPWWGYHFEPFTAPESATTGPDGRFAFTAPKGKVTGAALVTAAAPGLGVGWVGLLKGDKRTDLSLQLVTDDVPITGQIVDLEGKPVVSATVRVLQIMASPKEDLGAWLEAAKDKTAPPGSHDSQIEQEYLSRYTTAPCITAITDAAGRFRLTGVGRERLVFVQIDGPTIMSEHLRIITRPAKPFTVPNMGADPEYGQPRIDTTYYGADFRHAAAPTKPVVGIVRDKDTKKPLAGVTVRSEKLANSPLHGRNFIQTKTDTEGRYRLVGLPKGNGNKISLVPPDDLPYVSPTIDVPDSFGLDPVTVDVALKRAVWIDGRLTDRATGKPMRGAVTYIVRNGNPNLDDYPGFWGGINFGKATNADGTFRLIGLPGPGQILVFREDGYLLGAERDDADGLHEEFGHVPGGNFGAFARIDPPKAADSIRRDVTLVPGWTFTGTVLGPGGQPLAGAKPIGLYGKPDEVMKGAAFTVKEYNPRRPRSVFFRLPEKGWVGIVRPPAQNGDAVVVQLEPGATVTGRLVDAAGAPRPGVALRLSFRPKAEPHWGAEMLDEAVTTDRDGRFRVTALVPDMTYSLNADGRGYRVRAGLRPGETNDLGDVRFKP